MDNLDIYKRSMQHKREAQGVLLRVASELESLTSEDDWRAWLIDKGAKSVNPNWVSVIRDGVLVELHIQTMCMMAKTSETPMAIARYLLDMTQRDKLEQALGNY